MNTAVWHYIATMNWWGIFTMCFLIGFIPVGSWMIDRKMRRKRTDSENRDMQRHITRLGNRQAPYED